MNEEQDPGKILVEKTNTDVFTLARTNLFAVTLLEVPASPVWSNPQEAIPEQRLYRGSSCPDSAANRNVRETSGARQSLL